MPGQEKLAQAGLRRSPILPRDPPELADALAALAARRELITLCGASSKRTMAGPIEPTGAIISTARMNRVLQYEPRDLTISVEAGMRYADLNRLVAQNHQMVPLDPPFSETATIGGILAANTSGPRRRLYGTARDLVIGINFATLRGKIVQSGGMVVKNVAGLDMGKLMIGSFGTLAGIAVVNFKLQPRPSEEATFLLSFETLQDAIAARDRALKNVIPFAAMDLLNSLAAGQLGHKGHLLALQVGGNAAVIKRSRSELAGSDIMVLEGADSLRFWRHVEDYTPHFLEKFPHGVVVRCSSTLAQVGDVLASLETASIARAGSGVCYGYFHRVDAAAHWMATAAQRGWKAVIEFAPEDQKSQLDLWPSPGDDFAMMKKVKQMFDPDRLLNRGRLFRLL